MHRIAALGRYVLVPAVAAAAMFNPWRSGAPATMTALPAGPLFASFALGYAAVLTLMLAFPRRSVSSSALAAAIVVALAWALAAGGEELEQVLAALVGALAAAMPAGLRTWQRDAGGYERMSLAQLRTVRRRSDSPIHASPSKPSTTPEYVRTGRRAGKLRLSFLTGPEALSHGETVRALPDQGPSAP